MEIKNQIFIHYNRRLHIYLTYSPVCLFSASHPLDVSSTGQGFLSLHSGYTHSLAQFLNEWMKISELHNMLENKCYGVKIFFSKVRAIGACGSGCTHNFLQCSQSRLHWEGITFEPRLEGVSCKTCCYLKKGKYPRQREQPELRFWGRTRSSLSTARIPGSWNRSRKWWMDKRLRRY